MQIQLKIKYNINSGELLSVSEFLAIYLYGIQIQGSVGSDFTPEAIKFYIGAATKEVENTFNLKFQKQLIDNENQAYNKADYWGQFPIVQTSYPVRLPLSFIGFLNTIQQLIYPREWLTYNKGNISKRRISIVPTGSGTIAGSAALLLTGIVGQLGMHRFTNIPDYWAYQYVTGFDIDDLPLDLINIVGKFAAFGPLAIAGDLVFSLPGIANMSLSIDGLSQSVGSTASSTSAGYGARILQYQREINDSIKRLKLVYDQIKFEVL